MYICILDFEATCEDGSSSHEVIEFPSILWKISEDETELEYISEIQMFCKPKNNPKVSKFCHKLTGITQKQVDDGISFKEALKAHELWLREKIPNFDKEYTDNNILIMTCGHWDMSTMAPQEYKTYDIKKPHGVYLKYMNIKVDFDKFYKKKVGGMAKMLTYLGLPLIGRHHSGIDDCRNISKILDTMLENGFDPKKINVFDVKL
jgi:inhibitor of KinA sporulation pathway (predicted exonuclease)